MKVVDVTATVGAGCLAASVSLSCVMIFDRMIPDVMADAMNAIE